MITSNTVTVKSEMQTGNRELVIQVKVVLLKILVAALRHLSPDGIR